VFGDDRVTYHAGADVNPGKSADAYRRSGTDDGGFFSTLYLCIL